MEKGSRCGALVWLNVGWKLECGGFVVVVDDNDDNDVFVAAVIVVDDVSIVD